MTEYFTNPTDRAWSQPETSDLIRRWNEGEPQSEIARALNRTINCISGKVKRMRARGTPLAYRGPTAPKKNAQGCKVASSGVVVRKDAPEGSTGPVAISGPKPPRSVIPAPETIEVLNMRLMDMLSSHCRWPTEREGGEQRFCGNSATGRGAYCQHHAARMYAG